MANNGDDNNHLQGTPISSNTNPNPEPNNNPTITPVAGDDLSGPEDFLRSEASKLASQPLHYSEPDVWGVLTAISEKARRLPQGPNMLLTSDEHVIGQIVADKQFEILSNQISEHHCKIYKKNVAAEDEEGQSRLINCGFLRDTSTNGTYLNWERLNKNSPESKLHHGDIISFGAPPQHELAYAFVFREVHHPTSVTDGSSLNEENCNAQLHHCHCGFKARRWISWTKDNPGRRFMGCPNFQDSTKDCNYQKWIDPPLENQYYKDLLYEIHMELVNYKRIKFRLLMLRRLNLMLFLLCVILSILCFMVFFGLIMPK